MTPTSMIVRNAIERLIKGAPDNFNRTEPSGIAWWTREAGGVVRTAQLSSVSDETILLWMLGEIDRMVRKARTEGNGLSPTALTLIEATTLEIPWRLVPEVFIELKGGKW